MSKPFLQASRAPKMIQIREVYNLEQTLKKLEAAGGGGGGGTTTITVFDGGNASNTGTPAFTLEGGTA